MKVLGGLKSCQLVESNSLEKRLEFKLKMRLQVWQQNVNIQKKITNSDKIGKKFMLMENPWL